MGLRVRGIHSGEARTISNSYIGMRPEAIAQSPSNPWSGLRDYDETMRTVARNIAGIARSITRNIHQTYWDYTGDISNTSW